MPYRTLAPDLVLVNAIVHTMSAHDLTSTAVAIKNGKFVAVGSNKEIMNLARSGTVIEDLSGATVLPGLIDAHNHLLHTGQILRHIQLYDCRTIEEVLARVRDRASSTPPGQWLLGRGWDESLLAEARPPTRDELDGAAPNHPVLLQRVWNKLVVNSAALRVAGIDRNTPDPSRDVPYSGSFDRDERGEPTGLFRDRAKELVTRHIPPPTPFEFVDDVESACRAYNEVGLTAVAEPGLYPQETRAFHQARREDRLTIRTDMLMAGWGFGSASEDLLFQSRLADVGLEGGLGDSLLRLEGVKLMTDGGIGDRTARMFESYLDEPDNRGVFIIEPDQLAENIRWVHDLGWPMDCHTCGDEAQETVVRAYADAQASNPKPWLRHRVHHAYFPTRLALELMAKHQIPAVVSDPFILNLGESFVTSLGEDRAASVMPMRTYIDAGVPLAGSSDSPVSDFNPWTGICAAAMRQTVAGRSLSQNQRISTREALRSYTIGGAQATGRERYLGSIEPGKLADLIVLESDPLGMTPVDLGKVKPVATMIGGRWVYGR